MWHQKVHGTAFFEDCKEPLFGIALILPARKMFVPAGAHVKCKAFVSRRIVTADGIRPGVLLVEGERIREIVSPGEVPADATIEDFGEAALLPGLVDSHVHINEPGRTDWEGFFTATRAAAAGGYTMLVDMPLNCIPATTTVAALEAKRHAAQGQCSVDWAAWGGVVPGNEEEIEPLAAAGVRGFKCFLVHSGVEEFRMVTEQDLRSALPRIARTGLPLLVHAELPGPIDAATRQLRSADWTRYETYLRSRPDEAELSAIRLMLSLCREYNVRLHIVHLASATALEMLQSARSEGVQVTVETCPHYLHLQAETIADGATQCKCAPPIRSRENRELLWQGLKDRVIDMVVTDHSPCPPAMKRMHEGSFLTAWGGIASLSMALPVMWTEAQARGFTLSDISRWMSDKPAHLPGCLDRRGDDRKADDRRADNRRGDDRRGDARKGRLAAGYDADFVVFDPDAEFTVTKDRLHHRHAVSPYLGETLRGVVKRTYLRGNAIFCEGEFPGGPSGREFAGNDHS